MVACVHGQCLHPVVLTADVSWHVCVSVGWRAWQRYWEGSVGAPGGGAARLLLQLHSLRLRAAPLVGRDVRSHKRKARSEEKAVVPVWNPKTGLVDPNAAPVKRSHKRGQGIKARAEAVRSLRDTILVSTASFNCKRSSSHGRNRGLPWRACVRFCARLKGRGSKRRRKEPRRRRAAVPRREASAAAPRKKCCRPPWPLAA
jgi:hypothetical protein